MLNKRCTSGIQCYITYDNTSQGVVFNIDVEIQLKSWMDTCHTYWYVFPIVATLSLFYR